MIYDVVERGDFFFSCYNPEEMGEKERKLKGKKGSDGRVAWVEEGEGEGVLSSYGVHDTT